MLKLSGAAAASTELQPGTKERTVLVLLLAIDGTRVPDPSHSAPRDFREPRVLYGRSSHFGTFVGSMVQRGQFVTAYGQNVERSSVLKVSDADSP
jgi:hypothetical protein